MILQRSSHHRRRRGRNRRRRTAALLRVGVMTAVLAILGMGAGWAAGPHSSPTTAAAPGTAALDTHAAPASAHKSAVKTPAVSTAPAISLKAPPTPRPIPSPSTAWPARLQQSVTPYLESRSGTVEASVFDVDDGTSWTYGGNAPQVCGSIMKVQILETLLSQAQTTHRALTPRETALATTMIENSNNDAATDLYQDVGLATPVLAFDRSIGMQRTTPDGDYWGLTTTTATDQLALLRTLAVPNTALSTNSRTYALSSMREIESDQDWGVSAGVPESVDIALKNGWLPLNAGDWQINSIGIVNGQGRHYLIAVMTTADPSEQYGIDTVQRVASQAWSSLAP